MREREGREGEGGRVREGSEGGRGVREGSEGERVRSICFSVLCIIIY